MPASDDQVLNKQQSISNSTSTGATHATSPSTDSSSQDTKPTRGIAGGKRALLCGVTNKADPGIPYLEGSVNDVNRIEEMLIKQFGYSDKCIRVLKEDDKEINGKKPIPPTIENIVASLKWLVEGSESGDKLVFFFSGHCQAHQCRPQTHDHVCLVCTGGGLISNDYINMNKPINVGSPQTHDHVCLVCTGGGLISNDYINSTIVRPLMKGVTLYAIVDACFSGSILDLKYKYDQQSCSKGWDDNYKPPSKAEKGTSGGLAICLSACGDDQETFESNVNSGGKETLGAMTSNLTEMVEKNPNVTYEDILKKMQGQLRDESAGPLRTISNVRLEQEAIIKKIKVVPHVLSSSRKFEVSSMKFLL